jgi:hypothetical protein
MGETGLTSFNSVCQITKSQILAILDLESGDFDKLYLHHGPVRTRGDIMRDRHWHVVRADVHGLCECVRLSAPDTNVHQVLDFLPSFRSITRARAT